MQLLFTAQAIETANATCFNEIAKRSNDWKAVSSCDISETTLQQLIMWNCNKFLGFREWFAQSKFWVNIVMYVKDDMSIACLRWALRSYLLCNVCTSLTGYL